MRIVHISDWHGRQVNLPQADLYVVTGDMLPSYCVMTWTDNDMDSDDSGLFFNKKIEVEKQSNWVSLFARDGGFERFVADSNTPIICVRGNHDFIPIAGMFEGCNLVHEFVDNEVIEVLGKKIVGHRGIPYIYGSWNDEVPRPDLIDRFSAMLAGPICDMYVTHYPPNGILDNPRSRYGLESVAMKLLDRVIPSDANPYELDQAAPTILHTFGHIHEEGGRRLQRGNVLFSNAACNINVIDMW